MLSDCETSPFSAPNRGFFAGAQNDGFFILLYTVNIFL
jgi:hypothetical protein